MLRPKNDILPAKRKLAVNSAVRFKLRNNVVLPQQEGHTIAVMLSRGESHHPGQDLFPASLQLADFSQAP
jgi:hypothetical protein